ncbi:MAG: pyrroline-5-carboxylate reductase [Clostridia bacterium]|nr:pyrroline-5-carboxylate reductase [Clostridia bacterium]
MATFKFGFIGVGTMGGALARAVRKAANGEEIIVNDRSTAKAEAVARELGCVVGSGCEVARNAQFIFLGVKPQVMKEMLSDITEVLTARTDRFVLVSMAAGVSIRAIREMIKANVPIIRIMPNTPVAVGEGLIQYAASDEVFMDEIGAFSNALRCAGTVDRIEENLIDAGCAVAGCGPAYVYLFAEALADGAVACGLPRAKALEYAARTLYGSAAMMLSTDQHPAELKDAVCSPGGTTIEGVHALEQAGFRGAVMDAVKAAYEKSLHL